MSERASPPYTATLRTGERTVIPLARSAHHPRRSPLTYTLRTYLPFEERDGRQARNFSHEPCWDRTSDPLLKRVQR